MSSKTNTKKEKKTKVIAIEKLPTPEVSANTERYWLKVIRESEHFFFTKAIPCLGIIGGTFNERLKGEIRWNKETRRPEPFVDTHEYYRIFQKLAFVPVMETVI